MLKANKIDVVYGLPKILLNKDWADMVSGVRYA